LSQPAIQTPIKITTQKKEGQRRYSQAKSSNKQSSQPENSRSKPIDDSNSNRAHQSFIISIDKLVEQNELH